jgi:hypothetical protein
MNYTRKFTLSLDALLLVVCLVLLAPRFSGLHWHEWLGVVVIVPLLLHLLLSWTWIVVAFRRIFSSDGSLRGRINLLLNVALFVAFVVELVSGLVISQAALPFFGIHTLDDWAWRRLHNQTTTWIRILVALHVAMNWQWIYTTIAGLLRSARFAMARTKWSTGLAGTSARVAAIVAAMAMVATWPFWSLGTPTRLRLLHQNELLLFRASLFPGGINLGGQILALGIIAYVGHRWLRVRL